VPVHGLRRGMGHVRLTKITVGGPAINNVWRDRDWKRLKIVGMHQFFILGSLLGRGSGGGVNKKHKKKKKVTRGGGNCKAGEVKSNVLIENPAVLLAGEK